MSEAVVTPSAIRGHRFSHLRSDHVSFPDKIAHDDALIVDVHENQNIGHQVAVSYLRRPAIFHAL